MGIWWIEKPSLLASSNPTNQALEKLRAAGFGVLVSFLQEAEQTPRYDTTYVQSLGYERYIIPVQDFAPPTLEQLEAFIALVSQQPPKVKIVIHCEGGSGRTGTFAAAYWVSKGMTAAAAIQHVRKANSYAVETPEQQAVVTQYAKQL